MPVTDDDILHLRRAMHLAMRGRGKVEPNPMVGCVIVKDGRVIGEGWHQIYGGPHAEPNALASCTESPAGATAYVTLEPCCHKNKKTPPCAPRLIKEKLARVVIGCMDPNPDVDGKGVEMLYNAGIELEAPVLEEECQQLIAPFIARVQHRRPYVTLKWAQTADGKIAGPGGKPMQISSTRAREAVHELRARSDGILVGVNTVLTDDPMLTARGVETTRPLLRIVLDRHLRTPITSRLVQSGKTPPLLIICEKACEETRAAERKALMSLGVGVATTGSMELDHLMLLLGQTEEFGQHRLTHLLVEPGPTLARAFFEANRADRLWVIQSPKKITDASAPSAAAIPPDFIVTGQVDLEGDVLTEYLNPRSAVYFAPNQSADLARLIGA